MAIVQDVRYALRTLIKSLVFTFTVIATLAVGIGANTAMFSFVDVLLLRPLPYATPDRLVAIWEDFSSAGGPAQEWFTPPDFADVRDQTRALDAVSIYNGWTPNLTGSGEPERLTGAIVSANYFSLLGVPPAVGRAFSAEDAEGDGRVIVLSDALWQRRFGGDRGVLGTTLSLDGEPYTLIGVMPPSFRPPLLPAELWRPATATTFSAGCGRSCYVMRVLARIAPGATLERARADLASIANGIREQFQNEKVGFTFALVPLAEQLSGPVRPALLALLGAVGLLLLIACVNIANLLLARAGAREREVALKLAIGAGRGAIVRQLLIESVTLGLIGGAAGVLLAYWGIDALVALAPAGTPRIDEVAVDGRILGFALLLSAATGLVFGLVPALHLSRPNLSQTLREGGPRASGVRGRVRNALVVTEMAIALTLLAGAGLLMKSFLRLQAVDPGYRPENVLTVNMLLPRTSYADAPQLTVFYDELLARLRRRPGVTTVGATSILPLSGNNSDVGFLIEGRPLPSDRTEAPVAWYRQVTEEYFAAIGMRIVQGRGFTERDRADAPPVVVINETMARRYWPNEDPIGKRIDDGGPENRWVTIVGIVADSRHSSIDQAPLVEMYLPFQQRPTRALTLVLRTAGDPLGLVPAVREEVRAADPELPLGAINTMEQLVSDAVALPRLYLSFFAFFATVALLLASIGIYGVTANAVAQRTQEIGIRMALGAQSADVIRMMVRQAMVLVALGLVLGLGLALVLSNTLTTLLFDLSPTDPSTYALIAATLALVAFVATWLPASRATRVDPIVTLRTE
ncbi:MAG: ABC transporter permease [Longimicrobiales bacterium]